MSEEAFIAATRFGFGARPGQLAGIASGPRDWLRRQLEDTQAPPEFAGLRPGDVNYARMFEARAQGAEAFGAYLKGEARNTTIAEAARRTLAAVRSDSPFRERLVQFWGNHFTVSTKKFVIASFAGAFEREAIRPHIAGTFADMLIASTKHPAMLVYLDNVASMGPRSRAGRYTGRGLNENLAREILELHTLGVDGGYGQDDVIALAKLITGWGVAPGGEPDAGRFRFREPAHEPEAKTLLGREYRQGGLREGEAALRALAEHPSTARFIATKLARHFIADSPPPAAIARLERTFLDSGGDLGAVTRTLIDSPEPWQDPLPKAKSPNDLVISTLRALDALDIEEKAVIGSLYELGQFPFSADSPAGWPDTAADWLAPESLMRRIEWARAVANRAPIPDAAGYARDILGPVLSASTEAALVQAAGRREGAALMLASPEFQRR